MGQFRYGVTVAVSFDPPADEKSVPGFGADIIAVANSKILGVSTVDVGAEADSATVYMTVVSGSEQGAVDEAGRLIETVANANALTVTGLDFHEVVNLD